MRDLIEGNINMKRRPSSSIDRDGTPKKRSSIKNTDVSAGILNAEHSLEKQLNDSKEQVRILTEQLARTKEAGVSEEGGDEDEASKTLNKDSMFFRYAMHVSIWTSVYAFIYFVTQKQITAYMNISVYIYNI